MLILHCHLFLSDMLRSLICLLKPPENESSLLVLSNTVNWQERKKQHVGL